MTKERLRGMNSRGITHGHINANRFALYARGDLHANTDRAMGLRNDIATHYERHHFGEAPILKRDLVTHLVQRQPELALFAEYTSNLSMNAAYHKKDWINACGDSPEGRSWMMSVANPYRLNWDDIIQAKYKVLLRNETEHGIRSQLLLISEFIDLNWFEGQQPFFVPVLVSPIHVRADVVTKSPIEYRLLHPVEHSLATGSILAELPYQIGMVANRDPFSSG